MSELPQGWAQTTLEELAFVNPSRIEGLSGTTTVSFVPMPAVSDILGEIVAPAVRPFSEVSKGYTQFQEGDVIFAKITPCMENGKIAVARSLENGVACGSTEFHVVRPLEQISPDYVWRFLRQKSFRENAEASMTGAVGQRRVPASYLKESRVPLPPLPEQRRIVAKIDGLAGKSRRARDHLDHTPRLVEKYKQAILASTFSAHRGANRIALGSACEIKSGFAFKSTDFLDAGEVLVIRIGEINEGVVGGSGRSKYLGRKFLESASKFIVTAGDVVVSLSGYPGKSGVYNDSEPALLNQRVARLRSREGGLRDPNYLNYFIMSIADEIMEASYGAAQLNISPRKLGEFSIPWPDTVEREKIVEGLDRAFTWIERLAAEASSTRRLIDHLDQAVLAKAFRGELVPQDPDDEPASVLLERIRAERATAPKPKRGRRASVA